MFWVDKIQNELQDNQIINDSKTPSGRVHVGSLRGVVIHHIINKVLLKANKKTTFLYGVDDYDPLDELPKSMKKEFGRYMGMPLVNVPAPCEEGNKNFADYYMDEFINVFNKLGIYPKIYKMSEYYKSGKMNEVIEIILKNEDKIRDIYLKISGSKKPKTWHPFQVLCQKCGKIGTTLTHSFDGKEVEYTCEKNIVKWAKGCEYHGKISPFNGNGKLPWKLEWVAKWKVLGVTLEGAGKDHSSDGGSRDVSAEIFKVLFNKRPPYNIPYEFFLTGKKKMSSSKGLGATSKEITELIPPELVKFLMIRSQPNAVIDFNPMGDTIPRLFDEYDRCAKLFFSKDKSLFIERAFELSQTDDKNIKDNFLPRFSLLATLMQIPSVDIYDKMKAVKGMELSKDDINEIDMRKDYANKWLERCASDASKFRVLDELPEINAISDSQKVFIKELINIFDKDNLSGEEIHQMVYEVTQKVNIKPAEGFKTIYQVFIGKSRGPKVGTLLSALDNAFVKKRLKEVIDFL